MYAKTFLDSGAIAELATSENPKAYLNLFRENSILLLDPELYVQLSISLPTATWGRLKEDMIKGRQLMRVLEKHSEGLTRPSPDIIVESQLQSVAQPPLRCHLREFDDLPLVEKLMGLHRGEKDIQDRDEFWKICLRPVLEGIRPPSPTIEYFDSYVFHDSIRPIKKKDTQGKTKVRDHSGISWLLQKIETFASQTNVRPIIHLYSETDKGGMNLDEILKEFAEIGNWVNPSYCEIKLHLFESRFVDLAINKDLKHSLHSRTLFINRQQNFSFNYGTRNLGLEFNSSTGEYEDQIRRNWTWKPAVSDEWKDFLLFRITKLLDQSNPYTLM